MISPQNVPQSVEYNLSTLAYVGSHTCAGKHVSAIEDHHL